MNYTLIMKTGQSALVAIGPLSIEYQAAMLRDDIENSSDWTTVGIARVLTETQARALMNAAPRNAAPRNAEPQNAQPQNAQPQ